jgi:NitT/TauT family transport system substrate-binding protein
MVGPSAPIPGRAMILAAFAAILLLGAGPAGAADTLRVAKSPGYLFAYTPLDVGLAHGIFQAKGLAIDEINFEGAAKMDQGIVAGAVDIALGSPMDMSVIAKGMPAVAIAVIAQPMTEFAIIVPYDSPLRTLDDLKGKNFGIATIGSITEWCVLELAKVKGWDRSDVKMVGIGAGNASAAAAMKTHLVDADIANATSAAVFEREHIARRLARVSDYARPFIAHIMNASDAIVKENPDAVRRFVAAWFESVAQMRREKADTIGIAHSITGLSEADEADEYDTLMPVLTTDGHFDKDALQRIGQSFVDLGILDRPPDMAKLATEQFLPATKN